MNRILTMLLLMLMYVPVMAQTSSFDEVATGIPQPVPVAVRDDLRKSQGRAEITIVPDGITTGSQHFLRSEEWGFWIYRNRLHMRFFNAQGEMKLARTEDASTVPLPGSELIAGQPLTFTYSWSPAGIGLFVGDELRLFLEGDFNEPDIDTVYGASPSGSAPYFGSISVNVFDEPVVFDPCTNHPEWARVETFNAAGNRIGSNEVPPKPTCQTVPDPDAEPSIIIDGTAVSTFSWDVPTQNEDGSPLSPDDIVEYRLFWGEQSRVGRCTEPSNPTDSTCYDNVMAVPNGGSATSHPVTFSLDDDRTLYISMITVVDDEDGAPLVSKWSNEVARSFVVEVTEPEPEPDPTPIPDPPENMEVTVELTCTTNVPGVTCEIIVQ